LERGLRRVLLGLEPAEAEACDDAAPEQVALLPAGQLEDAAARGEDPAVTIADDEARARRGVVVVHQLEEEAEAAVAARHGLLREPLSAVDVDRALLAVRTDEVRQPLQASCGGARQRALPSREAASRRRAADTRRGSRGTARRLPPAGRRRGTSGTERRPRRRGRTRRRGSPARGAGSRRS